MTVSVPWAESLSRFTMQFESMVIEWLKEASTSTVSRLMGLSWNAIDGIMQRAVARGLSRRQEVVYAHIGVDETSLRKRHNYVTVVSNQGEGRVLHVGEDRRKETLEGWYRSLTPEQLGGLESVSMDMWPAFQGMILSMLSRKHSLRVFLLYLSKPVSESVVWRMDRVVVEMCVAIIECWTN